MAGGDGAASGLGLRYPGAWDGTAASCVAGGPLCTHTLGIWRDLLDGRLSQPDLLPVTCRCTLLLPIPSVQPKCIHFNHLWSFWDAHPLAPGYTSPYSSDLTRHKPRLLHEVLGHLGCPRTLPLASFSPCRLAPSHSLLDLHPSKNVGARIPWV